MTRDEIKAILPNISKEDLDKIMAINGSDIEKAKGDTTALSTQITNLTNQISDRDNQLNELKSKVTDNEALTKQITDLQNKNASAKNDYEKTIADMKRDFGVANALRDAKAKNVKAVLALVDMTKVKMDGDTVTGLADQIEALKKNEDTAFLFESGEGGKPNFAGGFKPGAGSEGKGSDAPASFSDAIKSSLAKIGAIKN